MINLPPSELITVSEDTTKQSPATLDANMQATVNRVLMNTGNFYSLQKIYEKVSPDELEVVAKEVDWQMLANQMGASTQDQAQEIATQKKVCELAYAQRKMQEQPSDTLAEKIGYMSVEMLNKGAITSGEQAELVEGLPAWHKEAAYRGAYIGESVDNDAKVSRLYAWKLAVHQRDPEEATKDELYMNNLA